MRVPRRTRKVLEEAVAEKKEEGRGAIVEKEEAVAPGGKAGGASTPPLVG